MKKGYLCAMFKTERIVRYEPTGDYLINNINKPSNLSDKIF